MTTPTSQPRLEDLLDAQHYKSGIEVCSGCENHCTVKVFRFQNGRSFYSGNNCEKVYSNEAEKKARGVNMFAEKYALLFIHQGLSVEIGPLAETVVSDKKWLSFLLEQIISNGAKYTHTGGMRIYMEGERLVLEDTGIGIRPEDLPRIFERGYTGYNGRLDSRASGIGLYMAKRVADALGIALAVESQLDQGTRVFLRFPDRDAFRFM